MKTLERITVYPIKALDGINLDTVEITQGGSLKYDREFAFVDEDGKFINGKKFGNLHLIKAAYFLDETLVEFSIDRESFKKIFHLEKEKPGIEKLFSEFLGKKISFQQNKRNGFPDDSKAYGPTVVGLASLQEVAKWFPNISIEELYKRFRPNLLLNNVPAFWEDKLLGKKGEEKPFHIEKIKFLGINSSSRCVVPTRNPQTGEAIPFFQKHFSEMRKATLPSWLNLSQFDHYYRFCVNTKIPGTEAGKILRLQDEVFL
ncbi:MAG: MOSC N-terminal beta barrel domain-containing protein [Ignavibacteriaceae bacterium]